MNIFHQFGTYVFFPFFFQPIINLLILFYKAFLFINIPGAFGFAIIAMTVTIRLLFHPFFKQQILMAKKMQEIKPQLDLINAKYKKEPQKLQQEQMRLYKEAGINPASGCLFMIIQLPIFIALYQALYEPFKHGSLALAVVEINKIAYSFLKIQQIDPWFFGFNLALTPQKGGQWFYYAVPIITGILQYLQVQTSTPNVNQKPTLTKKNNENEKKEDNSEDFQKAMNTQMKFIFPLMIGWFSFTLPVGLSLYWNIFSLFSIIQSSQLNSKK